MGAAISAFDSHGVIVATTQSDSQAYFSVTLPDGTNYPVVLNSISGTDMVTGIDPGFTMYSVVFDTNNVSNINVFSTIIVKAAQNMSNGLTPENVQRAAQIVATQLNYGLDPSLVPDPLLTVATPQNIATYIVANQALSETIRRAMNVLNSMGAALTADEYIDALAADISDGLVDGTGAPGSNPEYAAITNLVSAQVLTELLNNQLTINGVAANALMDNAAAMVFPAGALSSSDVLINPALLMQTKTAIKAALSVYGLFPEGDSLPSLQITHSMPHRYVWDTLELGKLLFIDRNYVFKDWEFSNLGYLGMKQLRTAKDDRTSAGDAFITFDINIPVTVYVAHEDSITPKPSWLATWTSTGDTILSRTIYMKEFSPGAPVVLGGNTVDGVTSGSMYMVFVEPATTPDSRDLLNMLNVLGRLSSLTTISEASLMLPTTIGLAIDNTIALATNAIDPVMQDVIAAVRENNGIIRVNAGGGRYVDQAGNVWSADKGYNSGETYVVQDSISNTLDDALYQSERWDPVDGVKLAYQFNVPNGDYIVNLHFMDRYPTAGRRVFNVRIDGTVVLDHLDIASEAGSYTALVKSIPATVTNGQISIDFVRQIENPNISAIEILKQPSATALVSAAPVQTAAAATNTTAIVTLSLPAATTSTTVVAPLGPATQPALTASSAAVNSTAPTAAQAATSSTTSSAAAAPGTAQTANTVNTAGNSTTPATQPVAAMGNSITSATTDGIIRVNAGGGMYVDQAGNVWSADKGYNTGNSYIVQDSISNTLDDALYQSERWDPATGSELAYQFTIPNGDYIVKLHFMDRFATAGSRVFDVRIDGTVVLDHLDIASEAGSYTALVKSIPATVTNGQISIDFVHQIENPNISAIEIVKQPSATALVSAAPVQTAAAAVNTGTTASTSSAPSAVATTAAPGGSGSNNSVASAAGNTLVTLKWLPNSDTVSGYQVYFGRTASSVLTPVLDLSITSGGFDPAAPSAVLDVKNDLGLQTGDTGCFSLAAYNTEGSSPLSAAFCATMP